MGRSLHQAHMLRYLEHAAIRELPTVLLQMALRVADGVDQSPYTLEDSENAAKQVVSAARNRRLIRRPSNLPGASTSTGM